MFSVVNTSFQIVHILQNNNTTHMFPKIQYHKPLIGTGIGPGTCIFIISESQICKYIHPLKYAHISLPQRGWPPGVDPQANQGEGDWKRNGARLTISPGPGSSEPD